MRSTIPHILHCFGSLALISLTVLASPIVQQVESVHKWDENVGIRPLILGELNFLHTTDVHGWLGSHVLQADYSADWGDFLSFIELFKKNRLNFEQDLLVIDTGDKLDGTGMSDATVPPGLISSAIFNEVDYDLLTLGNHELYTSERTTFEYYFTAQSEKSKDKYVSSNTYFIGGDDEPVPFGNKFVYLETPKNHLRILALSFMFNYNKTNPSAKVEPLASELQQDWFKDMVRDYPGDKLDVLVVLGHMPISGPDISNELDTLHSILRSSYPDTIIQYFGGHTHIRDFVQLDAKSSALQSGRFAETLGFLSISNITQGEDPTFNRRYIDFSKRSFRYHAMSEKLYTKRGDYVHWLIHGLRKKLGLDKVYGYVPDSYYMTSRPIDSKENIYNLIANNILPRLEPPSSDPSISRFVMLNSGAIRYDLLQGPFTKDSEYIVLPFPVHWRYIELPLAVAEGIQDYINAGPYVALASPTARHHEAKRGFLASKLNRLWTRNKPEDCEIPIDSELTEGYQTRDDYGCDGDDVPHRRELQFPIPNVIQYKHLVSADPNSLVQFIHFNYITDTVVHAANEIASSLYGGTSHRYTAADCIDYDGPSLQELLRNYFAENAP